MTTMMTMTMMMMMVMVMMVVLMTVMMMVMMVIMTGVVAVVRTMSVPTTSEYHAAWLLCCYSTMTAVDVAAYAISESNRCLNLAISLHTYCPGCCRSWGCYDDCEYLARLQYQYACSPLRRA